MILQQFEYSVSNLLHSDIAVAICQLEAEKLKDMISNVRDRGWGLVVVEAASGEHFLVFAASQVHQGNLIGDIRKWTQQYGYRFFLKLSDEYWATPRPDVFVLPDGREIEIRNVLTRAGNFTHSGLSQRKVLPEDYVQL